MNAKKDYRQYFSIVYGLDWRCTKQQVTRQT